MHHVLCRGRKRARRLPARPITVVVRTDASGTTQQVTEYLAADPADWLLGSGKTIGWPKCVVTVQGSDGVTQFVAANALSIGCVPGSAQGF